MRTLYLRIWLTVVLALGLFALGAGWVASRHLEQERARFEDRVRERTEGWAELIQQSLPAASAPVAEQREALLVWAEKLRLPIALDDAGGQRIAESDRFARHDDRGPPGRRRAVPVRLDDGRTLWLGRSPEFLRGPGARPPAEAAARAAARGALPRVPGFEGLGLALLLALMFVAVALGAYPVVRRLTRRLEGLKAGVEAFGAGALDRRVDDSGRDEVAAVAQAFNRAAAQVQTLVESHRRLLANASHELRSPLARLKMAVGMLDEADPAQRARLQREVHDNIRELDALVDEVLTASRLDAQGPNGQAPFDLLALAAEECARADAHLEVEAPPEAARGAPAGAGSAGRAEAADRADGDTAWVLQGDERLARRAVRNLLENARRYGGHTRVVQLAQPEAGRVLLTVLDDGPGVPEAQREAVFAPFYRLPGHAEREGGVGLGLSLVRQIAERHGGQVECLPPTPAQRALLQGIRAERQAEGSTVAGQAPGPGAAFVLSWPRSGHR